ncbi:MAG TPA: TonB-dependent receptor [Pyrinomonadaceae bacterium]|nr:TonB-dependent receptor [Pyrinomonadaceae bacterium]
MKESSAFCSFGFIVLFLIFLFNCNALAQSGRTFSGTVLTQMFEVVPNVTLEIQASDKKLTVTTDGEGRFSLAVPNESLSVKISGKNIEPQTRIFSTQDSLEDVQIKIAYIVPPVSENVTIESDALSPEIERRNDTVYKNSLFGRDDQLIFTLNAGINAGQHEGGGKSLEIRRFGFNLDHGGAGGGLKILVDDIQQNQGTQGHGQGYLGALKSFSPELIEDVSIINGPFSAAYGDFSGLGVVQIRQRESLPQALTARIQAGSFNTFRSFLAYSPQIKSVDSFIAYEFSRTNGPFKNPLKYRRDNVTGNFTRKLDKTQSVGFKFNFGRSDFFSSGQIPLDLVFAGELDRFGAIDPENGGKVRVGTASVYYRKEFKTGATFKADAFAGRSLFDLFSNFTFFAADPNFGDEIEQHDSRLQEGSNVQYLQPYKFFGNGSLVTIGGNLHLNQINVGLYPTVARTPNRKFLPGNVNNPNVLLTQANAKVNNYAAYIQNGIDFFNGHLRLELGLRFDYFSFDVKGFEISNSRTEIAGKESAGKFQPKLALAWSPLEKTPISFYLNYGRGISSQDARGVARNPASPKIATTDFYQAGTSYNARRVSAVFSFFAIDNSNQQIYIPDDGSLEFAGRSRSYGVEFRNSIRLTKNLSFNGGLTEVLRAFYPGQFTENLPRRRVIIDSAPHTTSNASLVLSEFYGFNSSLAWRHISNYRLDAENARVKASGNDVVDFSLSKRLKKWVDLNFSVDNLLNKKYFETQNYFESRTCPTCAVLPRIHATPGYSTTFSIGLTFRFWAKE